MPYFRNKIDFSTDFAIAVRPLVNRIERTLFGRRKLKKKMKRQSLFILRNEKRFTENSKKSVTGRRENARYFNNSEILFCR
jgi:hypothetical protein